MTAAPPLNACSPPPWPTPSAGRPTPCRRPKGGAPIDHIYGANLTWASARVELSTQRTKISDHPLVIATTAASSAGCAVPPSNDTGNYRLGPVKPELAKLVDVLAPMFGIKTVGGYRASARDPGGHPSGLAADFMVGLSAAGKRQGDALATYARAHAGELGIDYIIWQQRIWSTRRSAEGWRPMADRGSATENHRDHVHINVRPRGQRPTRRRHQRWLRRHRCSASGQPAGHR